MSKVAFTKLLHRIATCEVFYNNSTCPQAPVAWQLLVALANFGLSGNGGGCPIKAKLFALAGGLLRSTLTVCVCLTLSACLTDLCISSAGSVDNYTNRCIYAIMQLEKEYVRWPTPSERKVIKDRIGADSFFQECVGFIDGTLINLAAAPSHHKEDYWTRKSVYALNSLIICDDQRKVIYAHHGWCGSAHDQRVLKSTQVCSAIRLSPLFLMRLMFFLKLVL